MIAKSELIVIPKLRAHRSASGHLCLPDKFLSGMRAYVERWPGHVTAMVRVCDIPDSNLDHVEILPGEQPFDVNVRPDDFEVLKDCIKKASLVLDGPQGITGIRQVVVMETALRTQLQIIATEAPSPIRRWKRSIDAMIGDWKERRADSQLAGIQCNGTPTYEIYKHINPNTMLFFDSRIKADDLITEDVLAIRTTRLLQGKPLRLAFTGRLLRIKGADRLVEIADALRNLGVRFTMDICGGGECEQELVKKISQAGLDGQVRLRGVLKFREELLPFVRENIDLFVCPHVQGDPSCTYLETMACGVPVVGYANEAWAGMAPLSGAGWTTPMKRPDLLSACIAELNRNRQALVEKAKKARTFASKHLFEKTMDRRVEHFLSCL